MNIKRDPGKPKEWMIDASVKLPDGSFGHLQRKGYRTRTEAEADYFRAVSDFISKRGYQEMVKGSFEDLATKFLEHKSEQVKLSSLVALRFLINKHIVARLKGMPLKVAFTQTNCEKLRRYVIGLKLQQTRKNLILKSMYDISDYAFTRKYIDPEMYRLAKLNTEPLRGQDNPPPVHHIWTQEQYQQFIKTFRDSDKYRVLFMWMFFSGCRIGETCALQWKDFNLEEKSIRIYKTASSRYSLGRSLVTTPKTKASNRTIPLSDSMFHHLKQLKDSFGGNPDRYLFFGFIEPIGQTTIRTVFKRHIRMAGLPMIKVHEIRHTTTTWLIKGQASREEEQAIKKRLGHESLNVTIGTYFHHDPETEKKLAERIKIDPSSE